MATVLVDSSHRARGTTGSPASTSSSNVDTTETQLKGTDKVIAAELNAYANVTPLGVPKEEKRFWFQRTRKYDPNAIATQVCRFYSSTQNLSLIR